MGYHLLTGATGLLGNYLLRDLLLAGQRVAVVVRPTRRQNVRQRIEAALCHWDEQLGTPLPRPVVFAGDLTQPDLGLDGCSVRWISEFCDSVVHNAASLTFVATSSSGEPWRSNVDGTRNVLELCENADIRRFHHVSTAYVCGLRNGLVSESELDVGQTLSNDYERSKVSAEKLVRECPWIAPATVFRPAIIIGDSRTGYTTTYHGFYAALQLVHTIVRANAVNETGKAGSHLVRLSLRGDETKNVVPVDWVSQVMTHVLTRPELHGRTYHLTPEHPVTTRLIRDVLECATCFYGAVFRPDDITADNLTEIERLFYDHIRVYDSYWRDDPAFDRTNTTAAAPHLPCPHVDRGLLIRLSQAVIESNFAGPPTCPLDPAFDVEAHLPPSLEASPRTNGTKHQSVGLEVLGHGGGQWQLVSRDGNVVGVERGISDACTARLRVGSKALAALAERRTTARQAIETGEVCVEGLSPEAGAALLSRIAHVEGAPRRALPTTA